MGCTLANASVIERSVRSGDAALCQITLTTRFSNGRSVLSLDLCKSVHMLCTSHRSLAVQRRRAGIMHSASQACTAALPRRVKWLVQALAVCLLTASVAYSRHAASAAVVNLSSDTLHRRPTRPRQPIVTCSEVNWIDGTRQNAYLRHSVATCR